MAQLSKEIVKENLLDKAEMSDAHCHLELFKHPLEIIKKEPRFSKSADILQAYGENIKGNLICFLGDSNHSNSDGSLCSCGSKPASCGACKPYDKCNK